MLDLGSNTVHLLLVDAHHGAAPVPASKLKMPLRLSEHITPDGRIDTAAVDSLLDFIVPARQRVMQGHAGANLMPLIAANRTGREVGVNTEITFYGSSFIADAAVEIQSEEWLGTVDILHVDLYDHEAAAPVLDNVAFYKNCRALLSDEGTMTVNLFGRTSSYEKSLTKMAEAFGQDALWAFKPTREGNTVVMAQRIASRPKRDQLLAQAEAVENRFGLPATKWLKVFKPLVT